MSSIPKCAMLAGPNDEYDIPGLALASATSSGTLFAEIDALTTSTNGEDNTIVIGAKSRTESNGSFGKTAVLAISWPLVPASKV